MDDGLGLHIAVEADEARENDRLVAKRGAEGWIATPIVLDILGTGRPSAHELVRGVSDTG